MKNIVAPILGLIAGVCTGGFAQTYDIRGIVTDLEGVPIAGAAVVLEKADLIDTTESNGEFRIVGTSVAINRRKNDPRMRDLHYSLQDGSLRLTLPKKRKVGIRAFSAQGKSPSFIERTLDAGSHIVPLPSNGPGVVAYRVTTGAGAIVIKGVALGAGANRDAEVIFDQESNVLSKRNASTAKIDDVISVRMPGYLDFRMHIDGAEKDGIRIKMHVCADSVRDIDGNLYQAVRIGNQVWTTSNLRVTRLNNGRGMSTAPSSGPTWGNITSEAFCFYRNPVDSLYNKKFGALYNGYAAVSSLIAPPGWHVPTDAEWDTLQNYLIMHGYNWDDSKTENRTAKSLAAMTDWPVSINYQGSISLDLTKNNRSGFSAMPSGYRSPNENGLFNGGGQSTSFWSSTSLWGTDAYYRYMEYFSQGWNRHVIGLGWGGSIRLVRDR